MGLCFCAAIGCNIKGLESAEIALPLMHISAGRIIERGDSLFWKRR
ncbi:hypothetical protein AOX55_00004989 (plasmid) [Sinorhizobium fredii CCBAU 25509]|nr:hypothetical protein SF83666_b65310 [Sinorhizobium fredii CCBAU 83666]AWM27768.1 hypothetical protein AOX55_00004989 [Sinorhizobium fredii CCBAU 25509]